MILAFNKPYGVLSQFTPEPASSYATLADYGFPAEVYPVGRLDADSEGLLILTDEKGLVSPLLDPDSRHPRSYWVQVEGIPSEVDLERLRHGVSIRGWVTLPCSARKLDQQPPVDDRTPPIRVRQSIPTSWLELTLHEGKNRQVRRMTAAIGYPTLRLIRCSSGGLRLIDLGLGVGTWCVLTDAQRSLLLERRNRPSD